MSIILGLSSEYSSGSAKSTKGGIYFVVSYPSVISQTSPRRPGQPVPLQHRTALFLTDSSCLQSAVFFHQESVILFQAQHKFICLERKKPCILLVFRCVSYLVRFLKDTEQLLKVVAITYVMFYSHIARKEGNRMSTY